MNLQEIVEKNNLTVGDWVLCTYSGTSRLETGEHVIQESPNGRFPMLKGTDDMYWMGNSCEFELIEKKPTDTELVIEDLFDTSAKVTAKYIDDLHCLVKKYMN